MGNCASTKSVVCEVTPTGVLVADAVEKEEEHDWKIMSALSPDEGWEMDRHHRGEYYWFKKKKDRVLLPDSIHVKHKEEIYEVLFEEGPPSKTRKVRKISPFHEKDGLWVSYITIHQSESGTVTYVSNGVMLNCIEHYAESSGCSGGK